MMRAPMSTVTLPCQRSMPFVGTAFSVLSAQR